MEFDVIYNCSGKVNINDWQLNENGLFHNKEVEHMLFPQTDCPLSHREIRLFDCIMPEAVAIMNFKHLINCME